MFAKKEGVRNITLLLLLLLGAPLLGWRAWLAQRGHEL